ncbi:hypothetical protein DSO57_1016297 [Entomophthora muscae]|uniref:Uncharacterized protein n=1 Tax=Entomophthora muscae TaxID=34485 RepID=A0ACC2T594_9FUNG|nr:hypothetical protein DSO57_1016297 [Entomophthora muscae]
MLFPLDITQKIQDATSSKNTQDLLKIPKWSDYETCLKLMFYRGKVMKPPVLGLEPACLPWLTTLIITAIPLGLLFLKLFLSFIPPQRPSSVHNGYSSCILFIPCFNETRDELEACLASVIETNYIDHGKLLFVVCDGQFCADVVLDILAHQGSGSAPKSYQSVGKGNKAINSAQVYSGYHYHGAHGVPYIVVVKTGNVHESEFSGNRGKRDSMLVVLNFLDGISSPENLLTPLEAEILESIQGLDLVPSTFNYLFCVDADTYVDPDSLPLMLHYLDSRPDCLAVSGQIRFNSGGHWLLDPLQRFRACFSRHQDMCAMSALDTLTSLNGGFTAYRLQQSTGTRCLVHEDVVFQLSSKRTNTLHTKHLLLLGEEQYIATLLLRCWPGLRLGYVPSAFAKTAGYASLWQLIVKERSAFCTRFHNLLDLWTSSAIWGINWVTFVWVSFSLLWCFLMPVFTGFLYFQLVRVVLLRELPFLVTLFLAGACLLLSFVFCLFNYHPGLVIGLLLYLVVGIPLYHIIIPLYSFLSMDNFNWYDLGGDQTRARPHGAMEEVLGRPIKAMHDRSMKPYEKSFKHLTYRSEFLPAPGMFQSLYSELNRMGMPIDMPSGDATMIQGDTVPLAVFPNQFAFSSDSSYGNLPPQSVAPQPPQLAALSEQQPMRVSLPPRTPLTARHIPGLRDSIALNTGKSFNRAQVRMSDSHGPSFSFEPVPNLGLGLAKDFPLPPSINSEIRQHDEFFHNTPGHSSFQSSVLGAGGFHFSPPPFAPSVPHSEYNSDFSLSVASLAHYDTYLEDNASLQSSLPNDRFSHNVTATNGLPNNSAPHVHENPEAIQQSKAMIREEIDYFLRDADLHTVTRREVKEHLLAVFGDNVSFYQDFVSQCIEEFTLERLATQDPRFHPPNNGVRSSQLL